VPLLIDHGPIINSWGVVDHLGTVRRFAVVTYPVHGFVVALRNVAGSLAWSTGSSLSLSVVSETMDAASELMSMGARVSGHARSVVQQSSDEAMGFGGIWMNKPGEVEWRAEGPRPGT
jgi:hypothetical protein